MSSSIPDNFATIEDVQEIIRKGPWDTKSGGELNVLFGIPFGQMQDKFFRYDDEGLSAIPQDIRGLRSYRVGRIRRNSIGANEWHVVRQELVFALEGTVRWISEDLHGNKSTTILDKQTGIWVPPYILHTYEALSDDSCLLVIANTIFIPDDPMTHDTYSAASFRHLQNNLSVRLV
jgi:hypothetical protein